MCVASEQQRQVLPSSAFVMGEERAFLRINSTVREYGTNTYSITTDRYRCSLSIVLDTTEALFTLHQGIRAYIFSPKEVR
jgi:hypothetical protein